MIALKATLAAIDIILAIGSFVIAFEDGKRNFATSICMCIVFLINAGTIWL